MRKKIVLIDGHSILNRAFYGIPDLTNAEGLHTNAVYGFLNILLKILDEEKADYLTVAFDVHAPTFRHEMYADYKGTRKPMLPELREQVPLIKDVLKSMGICIVEKAGLEADDILGTLSRRAEKEGMDVTILSGDRDLLQLATDRVQIRIPKTKKGHTEVEDYYASDVLEKYQVTPTEFIDLKALMGDTSDNIPGVPGIGEKTATKIIVEYKSIENAFEHVSELKPPRASKMLAEHYDMAQMSKELAAICVDAELDYEFSEAELGNIFTEEAYGLFQRLEFKNLLKNFDIEKKDSSIENTFEEVTDLGQAEKIFAEAEKAERAAIVWIENGISSAEAATMTAAAKRAKAAENLPYMLGISYNEDKTYRIAAEGFLTKDYLEDKVNSLAKKTEIICYDIKAALKRYPAIREDACQDLILMAYLLNPLKNDYAYDSIAREYLNLMPDERMEAGKLLCYQTYTAFRAYKLLIERLCAEEMDGLYCEMERPLIFVLNEMEVNGVEVRGEALEEYGRQLSGKIDILEQEIYDIVGEKFNINSPKQLGVILFEKMGLPNGKKTKTGYSTAADVLDKLAPDYPVVSKILEYRQLTKLKSTYADGLAVFIGEDNRIHGTFNQTITATGRISSTEPNLQNIPIRMELGRLIRKVFVPADGYTFVDADYSQIELRILAHLSKDEKLIEAYHQHEDIHRITASQVFHIPFEDVTPLQRRNAKAVNFGIIYGISSFGLGQDLNISRKEAAQYMEDYFATYPSIKAFQENAVQDAKEKGYAITLYGRRRPMPELKSSNFMQRSFGERVAMNAPIQGTAADIMKIAMIGVSRALKEKGLKSRLLIQVHDELLIEAANDEIETVKKLLAEEMEKAAELSVPLEVDVNTGVNWYEAK